jgi:signal transduction histidine kinase
MNPAPAAPLEILVVDDNKVDREAIKRYLGGYRRDMACNFHEADSAEGAISLIEKHSYDCVFLDYRLPDMDGISVLKKLYNSETDLLNSPVVMLTGDGSESVMLDALRLGAQDYIMKDSITPEALKISIAKAREMYEAKRARRQAEEQLQHTKKMDAIGRLTSGISHDFNNLLTAIVGNIHLLRRKMQAGAGAVSPEELEKRIDAIELATNRGTELVRRLMVFTRQSALAKEITDPSLCVDDISELLKSTLGGDIIVKTILKEDTWPVMLDISEFENMLINFAVNARDAMPKGGKLTIEVDNITLDESYALRNPDAQQGDYVMIAISDTGTGMSKEVQQRVFEPFFTTKAAGEGTGLGMSMAYGFVQQCGGHIHVYSEEGCGTVFRIYLPRYVTEEDEVKVPLNLDALPKGTETILVTDDDEFIRMMAVSMLEKLGYRILQAPTGRVALEMLKREHKNVDLVFTDIVMPGGMNGIELVRQIRAHYPGIKALYTSGYTLNSVPDYQLNAGEQLLSKPYRREVLAQKIRETLDEQSH